MHRITPKLGPGAVVGFALLTSPTAPGRTLDTEHLSLDVWKNVHYDSPYADYSDSGIQRPGARAGERWSHGVGLNWSACLVCAGPASDYAGVGWYWTNRVRTNSTSSQFRDVAWEFEHQFRVRSVELFWHHRSEHLLDLEGEGFYPLKDQVGVRFNLNKGD